MRIAPQLQRHPTRQLFATTTDTAATDRGAGPVVGGACLSSAVATAQGVFDGCLSQPEGNSRDLDVEGNRMGSLGFVYTRRWA